MEEIRSSPTRSTRTAVGSAEYDGSTAGMKNKCLTFLVSLREGFQYGKASLVGLAKKLTARSEGEAAKAELTAEKMQVDAANAAEQTKARIRKSS